MIPGNIMSDVQLWYGLTETGMIGFSVCGTSDHTYY